MNQNSKINEHKNPPSGDRGIKVGIAGGAGYTGGELIRLLINHPNVELSFVHSKSNAGNPVYKVHQDLIGETDLKFTNELNNNIDVLFLCVGHGEAKKFLDETNIDDTIRIIDLSQDFRLHQKSAIANRQFVYGLPELNKAEIKKSQYLANPGCFATATLLALAPMVKSGLLSGRIIVDAKTGSSGSGAKPAANTHHPQRMNSFYAYKPFIHQHVPEIEQHLHAVGRFGHELVFMTHSLPVARGIFASCYLETTAQVSNEDLQNLYRHFYESSFFVRLVDGSPDINWVKNTNFCDIAAHSNGKQIVVFSAIDNLVKGAAGQAVQNMNLMFGLDETKGLIFSGGNP